MKTINPTPRLTMTVVSNGLLRNAPFTIADVGAAGGFAPMWRVFGDQLRVIGFEPGAESFKRLVSTDTCQYYNVALGKNREPITVFITRWPYSSGSYPAARDFLRRFPNDHGFDIISQETLSPVPLDEFRRENNVATLDYMKLDTEGSELDILMGGEETLSHCLAVEIEVAFTQFHKGRPLFSEVEQYMRAHGFALYDLDTYRHARAALPPIKSTYMNPSDYGQVLWGDALFMRDFMSETDRVPLARRSEAALVKMVCLYEMFNQIDSAVELLEAALQQGALQPYMQVGLDLLLAPTLDRNLSLASYRELFARLPQPI